MEERHGMSWSKKEDKQLKKLFNEHKSFAEMGRELSRTWFACKCRLIRLGLLDEPLENKTRQNFLEPYRVPNPGFRKVELKMQVDIEDEDTSMTFSNAELNIVRDYLKNRMARLAIQALDDENIQTKIQVAKIQEVLTEELNKVNVFQKLDIEQRQRVLVRIA